jgi:hypothetical protein
LTQLYALAPPNLAPGKKAMMVFYEYMGLVNYGLRGHFLTQSLPEAKLLK